MVFYFFYCALTSKLTQAIGSSKIAGYGFIIRILTDLLWKRGIIAKNAGTFYSLDMIDNYLYGSNNLVFANFILPIVKWFSWIIEYKDIFTLIITFVSFPFLCLPTEADCLKWLSNWCIWENGFWSCDYIVDFGFTIAIGSSIIWCLNVKCTEWTLMWNTCEKCWYVGTTGWRQMRMS